MKQLLSGILYLLIPSTFIAFFVVLLILEREKVDNQTNSDKEVQRKRHFILSENDRWTLKQNSIPEIYIKFIAEAFLEVIEINPLYGHDYNSGEKIQSKGIEVKIKPISFYNYIQYIHQGSRHYKDLTKASLYTSFTDSNNGEILSFQLINSNDKFNLLKAKFTHAVNYGYETEDLIDWLKNLEKNYPLEILGNGDDWIWLWFTKEIPEEHLNSLTNKICKFCPDIILQTNADKKKIKELLSNEMPILFLWWD